MQSGLRRPDVDVYADRLFLYAASMHFPEQPAGLTGLCCPASHDDPLKGNILISDVECAPAIAYIIENTRITEDDRGLSWTGRRRGDNSQNG